MDSHETDRTLQWHGFRHNGWDGGVSYFSLVYLGALVAPIIVVERLVRSLNLPRVVNTTWQSL